MTAKQPPQVGPMVPVRPSSPSAALDVVKALPPEAITKVIDIMGDIVRTQALLAEKREGFTQEITKLREANARDERVLGLLSQLLLGANLDDVGKNRLVGAICDLALR